MYLVLQITAPPVAASGPNSNKIFSESGGTIGRADANDWVLQDDERFISGRHAIIRWMGGVFSLEDVSTNGVYLNDGTETVGSGNEPVALKSGDRIIIGDYQIYVQVVEGESAGAQPVSPPAFDRDPLVTSPTGHHTGPPTAAPRPPASINPTGPLDPLELIGRPPPPPPSPPPAMSDHSSALSGHFSMPAHGGGGDAGAIPEDFLDDLTGFGPITPPPPAQAPPQQAPAYGQPPAAPSTGSGNDLLDQLMPLIVQGMMEVLQSRTEIKRQFRLAQTTMKPQENNPLKFSPNMQDAMRQLMSGGQSGYMGPVEAFREGFRDIKAHELAMMAGMRAAFEHMLQQFSPDVLEERFEGGAKRSKLMGMASKVRYWEQYREMFERLTRDSDDNFRRLFGEEFAIAYERQMQNITRSR